MYRTNWGIGHGLKDILEAHKGPFTGQGHKGLYEIDHSKNQTFLGVQLDSKTRNFDSCFLSIIGSTFFLSIFANLIPVARKR